jgi:hypothetical protein
MRKERRVRARLAVSEKKAANGRAPFFQQFYSPCPVNLVVIPLHGY